MSEEKLEATLKSITKEINNVRMSMHKAYGIVGAADDSNLVGNYENAMSAIDEALFGVISARSLLSNH